MLGFGTRCHLIRGFEFIITLILFCIVTLCPTDVIFSKDLADGRLVLYEPDGRLAWCARQIRLVFRLPWLTAAMAEVDGCHGVAEPSLSGKARD